MKLLQMKGCFLRNFIAIFIVLLSLFSCFQSAVGIRFVIDREECFAHLVPYEGDTVHVSFVVIKVDSPWSHSQDGVDLVVKGPSGDQIVDLKDKSSEKFEFVVHKRGFHHFCFTNKSPYHETVDFDVHIGYFFHFDDHAKAVNEAMSRRAIHNALFEFAALIGASLLQVYLLRRLVE